jgi:hypothetical protein
MSQIGDFMAISLPGGILVLLLGISRDANPLRACMPSVATDTTSS